MHVGWLATIGLAAGSDRLDVDDLSARLSARLHLVPRFRQVVRSPPGGLSSAAWVDSPTFRLTDHLSVESGKRVGDQALTRLADRFFSEQLPRNKPLWHLHIVPRLSGGRAAVLGKVHHAMVDGIAAVQLGLLLFDVDPNAPAGEPRPWEPAGRNSLHLAADAARDSALTQFRTLATPRAWDSLRAADSGSPTRCAAQRSRSQRTRYVRPPTPTSTPRSARAAA